jgi:hypothetical protein
LASGYTNLFPITWSLHVRPLSVAEDFAGVEELAAGVAANDHPLTVGNQVDRACVGSAIWIKGLYFYLTLLASFFQVELQYL